MKKFLMILVLSLFISANAYAGLFSKDEFKFEKCYTESYSNYNDWRANSLFLKWKWEINLKNKTATRIAQLKDNVNEMRIDQFQIIAVTKEFIKTNAPTGTSYVFYRKNGQIQVSGTEVSMMRCEVFD